MSVMGVGVHPAKVVQHQLGKSGTGTPHVAVLLENAAGDRITWYGYLTDAALEYTLKTLGVMGWDPVAHDGQISSLNETDLLVGAEVEVVVETEEWNGEHRAKVKWINQPGGGLGLGMEADDAKSLAAKLRKKILAAPRPKVNAQAGPSRPAARAAAPAGAAAGKPLSDPDDDLPF